MTIQTDHSPLTSSYQSPGFVWCEIYLSKDSIAQLEESESTRKYMKVKGLYGALGKLLKRLS